MRGASKSLTSLAQETPTIRTGGNLGIFQNNEIEPSRRPITENALIPTSCPKRRNFTQTKVLEIIYVIIVAVSNSKQKKEK